MRDLCEPAQCVRHNSRSCSHTRTAAWAALFSPRRAGYVKQQPDPQGSDGSLRQHAWASVRSSVRGSSKAGYGSLANSTSTLMTELSGGTANSGSTEMVRRNPRPHPKPPPLFHPDPSSNMT